jgi:hypothetical protein
MIAERVRLLLPLLLAGVAQGQVQTQVQAPHPTQDLGDLVRRVLPRRHLRPIRPAPLGQLGRARWWWCPPWPTP